MKNKASPNRPNLLQQISNTVTSRLQWFQGLLGGCPKDVEKECGHPGTISLDDFKNAFLRGDIGQRIIRLYPEECWSEDPEVFETEDEEETEFEKAWKDLEEVFSVYELLQRADILSGVGRFGVILLGLDDEKELNKPVIGLDELGNPVGDATRRLLYLRAFDETFVAVKAYETRQTHPRFGQPTIYTIQFGSEKISSGFASIMPTAITSPDTAPGTTTLLDAKDVHWTRIIHLADNRANSDVFGLPRLEVVYNRYLDLKKVAGGSGEMFWKGAWQGLGVEIPFSDAAGVPVQVDFESLKEQFFLYEQQLQRYIATQGAKVSSLAPGISDPTPSVEVQLLLIAITLACPLRVLKGAEVGQLASGQDMVAWNKRMNRRRNKYVNAKVIRPFVDRLIALGVLPSPADSVSSAGTTAGEATLFQRPKYMIHWPDLNTPSDMEKAEVSAKITAAITQYITAGGDQVVGLNHFLTLVLKFTTEEADAIMADLEEAGNMLETDPEAEAEMEMAKIEATAKAKQTFAPKPANGR